MIYERLFSIVNDVIYSVTHRMNETTKTLLVFLCALVLEGFFFTNFAAYGKSETAMIFGSLLVVLISIFCVRRRAGTVKYKKTPYIFVIVFAIGIIMISFHHNVGGSYLILATDLLIVFPFLYYVAINSDCTKMLFKMFSYAALVESIGTFFICIIFSFQGNLVMYGSRVAGHLNNPNLLGAIGLIAFISGLYLVLDKNNPISIDLIVSSVMGIGAYYMIASSSRAALLTAIGCMVAFVIFIIKRNKYGIKKNIITRVILLATVFILTLIIGMALNDINARSIEKKGTDAVESEQIVESQDQSTDEMDELQRRLNLDKDMETFTSGRTGIWKIYIDNFSFWGKAPEDVKEQFVAYSEWRAHNNIIEYYFKLGYLVGTFYLVFFVIIGVYGLGVLVSQKYIREEDFFLVAIIGSYALYSMVEIATLPFTRIVPCIFFLSISSSVFTKEEKRTMKK